MKRAIDEWREKGREEFESLVLKEQV